jgi:ParB family chromosome partitioning protein
MVPPDEIQPNPYQPRLEMDQEALEELAQSIRVHGLLEPLLVRRDPLGGEGYQLIAGERRLRAAQLAGLSEVPVIQREATDAELLEIALVENIQRENLNPIDEARGYQLLLKGAAQGGAELTQQEVAERVGKSRAVIANLLRLLELPDYVQTSIQSGQLSQGHGKILAGLDPQAIQPAWHYAASTQCSVRELEGFLKARAESHPSKPKKGKTHAAKSAAGPKDPHWQAVEEALQERLRTRVSVQPNADGSGRIEIQFFNSEDLDRLLESLDIEL